jgi:tetratricopeptide (TPR) repeat protein/Zn-dependent protease with chaperone function
MSSQFEPSEERSLSDAGNWPFTLRASFFVFLFYAFALACILVLTACVVVEFAIGFIGGRFFWAAGMRRALKIHFRLLKTFVQSLRLTKAAAARIPLQREEAPEVFLMIESLRAQTQIAVPQQILVEMQMNAWIRLDGFWSSSGSGQVVLGLGYDLLAGLTRGELEVVLAHELMHASVTQRSLRHWLDRGLERALQLRQGLAHGGGTRHRPAHPSLLPRQFLAMSNRLAESSARWIAAAARHEEFKADWGAAGLCGSQAVRATLVKVESLSRAAARLSTRERVAHLQAHSFALWLAKELSSVKMFDSREIAAEVPKRFSTHPSLRDRLNALPFDSRQQQDQDMRPAIEMLTEADAIAERLMAKIQQTAVEQEERDSRELRGWARKMRVASEMRPAQIVGAVLVVASEIAAAVAWIVGATSEVATIIIISSIVGLLIYWLGRYREQFVLAVPDFALLKATWPSDPIVQEKIVKDVEATWDFSVSGNGKPWTVGLLATKSIEALRECDYAKAEFAASLCLQNEPDCVPALLVSAIAGAWLGKGRQVTSALSAVQRAAGLRGPSICWGVAWAYMLRGNWARAEALLQQAIPARPTDPTLLNLRALCQSRRGKIQSAIASARRACHPRPVNREHAKFLVDLLLEGGYLQEARQQFSHLEKYSGDDSELMLTAVRLNLLLHNVEAADHWAELLLQDEPPPYLIVRLGAVYELATQFEQASRFYANALAGAFFPDACLGLARLAAKENNLEAARYHTFEALSLCRALGRFATPPLELLRPILLQLSSLEPPSRFCQAWVASLSVDFVPTALSGKSFIIFAEEQPEAERYLRHVLEALSGGKPRLVPGSVAWRLGGPEQQPVGLVFPGIQPLSDEEGHTPLRGFQRQGLWQPPPPVLSATDAADALQCA